MTSAKDNQPAADHGAREALLRDLYALAAFYLAHPDHPLPTSIQVFHDVPGAEVERVAAEYADGSVYGDVPQTHHRPAGLTTPVTMVVANPSRTERPL